MNKKNKTILLVTLILFVALLAVSIGFCASTISQGELARSLAKEGTDTIVLDGTVKIKKPLTVRGNKKICGNGTIVLTGDLAGKWPDDEKGSSWGTGCTTLSLDDTDQMSAMFNVSDQATLVLDESVSVDAQKMGNVVHVNSGGTFEMNGKSAVVNGRYANVVVEDDATANINAGKIKKGNVYGIVNYGMLNMNGGKHSGSCAVVYNVGTTVQNGGEISKASVHKVYVSA